LRISCATALAKSAEQTVTAAGSAAYVAKQANWSKTAITMNLSAQRIAAS
jgi:hypothetical protein